MSAENNVYDLSSNLVHLKLLLYSIQISYFHPNDASLPLLCLPSFEGFRVREITLGSPPTVSKTSYLITWNLSFPTCKQGRNSNNTVEFKGLNGAWKSLIQYLAHSNGNSFPFFLPDYCSLVPFLPKRPILGFLSLSSTPLQQATQQV